jgi:hypothetical protein
MGHEAPPTSCAESSPADTAPKKAARTTASTLPAPSALTAKGASGAEIGSAGDVLSCLVIKLSTFNPISGTDTSGRNAGAVSTILPRRFRGVK